MEAVPGTVEARAGMVMTKERKQVSVRFRRIVCVPLMIGVTT
jgi:hypothetical protein